MLTGLVRLARPQDWIKNIFVLLPLPFALKAMEPAARKDFSLVAFLLGLAGFCLVNSAIYTLNDLCDAAADRLHPTKARPANRGRGSEQDRRRDSDRGALAGGIGPLPGRSPAIGRGNRAELHRHQRGVQFGRQARHVAGRVPALLGIRNPCNARVRVGFGHGVAMAAAVHGHAGAVPGFRQAAGRPDRRARPESSPQPPRLQQGVSRPGGGDLRRCGPGELCADTVSR